MAKKLIFGTRLIDLASGSKSEEAPATIKTTVARPAIARPAKEG